MYERERSVQSPKDPGRYTLTHSGQQNTRRGKGCRYMAHGLMGRTEINPLMIAVFLPTPPTRR